LDWLQQPEIWAALLTLIGIELVLAVDNLLFISIVSARLPEEEQVRARTMGLALAWVGRMILLVMVVWAVGHTATLFVVAEFEVTIEVALLILGGAFLIGRSTYEIHQRIDGGSEPGGTVKAVSSSVASVVVQIGLLDMVFSLDSVLTAVGLTRHLPVMMVAATVAILAMMLFATPVAHFVNRTPTIRMLTLAFLLLIGVNLIAEGIGQYIPRGYIYFAMGFALFVEFLNLRAEERRSR
jgi:predicted tellurium resistance membrane protein TerC